MLQFTQEPGLRVRTQLRTWQAVSVQYAGSTDDAGISGGSDSRTLLSSIRTGASAQQYQESTVDDDGHDDEHVAKNGLIDDDGFPD